VILRGRSESSLVIPPEGTATDTIPSILIKAFPPYADALLAKCGELVTDDMLEEISRADYGMEADAHLAALVSIRDEVRVPAPLPWQPKEVLELVGWSQPEKPAWKPGSTGERGHIMRAFCCAALLRAAAESANQGYFGGENQTLIQLIESALILGRGLPEAAGSFLTWRIPLLRTDDDERPFFAFGLVALALSVGQDSLTAHDIDALVDYVDRTETAARDPMGVCTPDMFNGSFLAGTCYDRRHAAWRALAAKLRSRVPDAQRLVASALRIEAK
jgi:hypothetical protein